MMNSKDVLWIDVRDPEEFESEHVPQSINIPLSTLNEKLPELCQTHSGKKIVFLCQSGNRAKRALEIWNQNSTEPACIFEGGIFQWKLDGHDIFKSKLPIIQQVQLTVGILLVLFSISVYMISIYFLIPIFFLGFGLSIAGFTGFCGLAKLLVKMPWNAQSRLLN